MGQSTAVRKTKRSGWRLHLLVLGLCGGLTLFQCVNLGRWRFFPHFPPGKIAPLEMTGGDPHIRALMRTISATEANDASPYTLLYGGTHIQSLSQHPDRCVPIHFGPNQGNCTTAAGRYQFLTTTWLEKAALYHPNPSAFLFWETYSFEPEYQDRVVYAWLTDPLAWDGVDISALLAAGKLSQVLRLLSSTWTSLGYGIENNAITPYLQEIYHHMLAEELGQTQATR